MIEHESFRTAIQTSYIGRCSFRYAGHYLRIKNAESVDEILKAREDYLKFNTEYYTADALSYMRYSINTADEFYVAEKEYYDEIGPQVKSYIVEYSSALLDSPFRKELEGKSSLRCCLSRWRYNASPCPKEIVGDMVEENRLVSEYSKLMAGMEFEFRGEKMPRATLAGFFKSDDRETRREAYEVLGRGLEQHKAELDRIYDELVHVRDRMAKKDGL